MRTFVSGVLPSVPLSFLSSRPLIFPISLRQAEGIGRPLGTADFVTELERRLGRPIARRAPRRKAATTPVGEQLNLLL